jgi:hypothetical protein
VALAEAAKRGLLSPEQQGAFEEATRRGLLGGASPPQRGYGKEPTTPPATAGPERIICVRSVDGIFHVFPAGTDKAVIDRTITAYAEEHQLASGGYAILLPDDVKLDTPTEPVYRALHDEAIRSLRGFAVFGLGVPVAVLFLGIAGWWIVRGFRPKAM